MIAGTQLAVQRIAREMPLPLDRNERRIMWHAVGSPIRIIAVLRTAIERRIPVGYEDETGFHYGAETTDWSFSI